MASDDPTTAATVKIAAGMRNFEILAAAAEKNITVVTGADPNVGIGGWITGGGHGPLSSLYGLGADQAISMEVVTADGRLLQVDKDHHKDLFWAMRGVSQYRHQYISQRTNLQSSRVEVQPSLSSSPSPSAHTPLSLSLSIYSATTPPPTPKHSGTSPPCSTPTFPGSPKPAPQATTTQDPSSLLSPTPPNAANSKASSSSPKNHPPKPSPYCNPSKPQSTPPPSQTKSTSAASPSHSHPSPPFGPPTHPRTSALVSASARASSTTPP